MPPRLNRSVGASNSAIGSAFAGLGTEFRSIYARYDGRPRFIPMVRVSGWVAQELAELGDGFASEYGVDASGHNVHGQEVSGNYVLLTPDRAAVLGWGMKHRVGFKPSPAKLVSWVSDKAVAKGWTGCPPGLPTSFTAPASPRFS